VVTKWCPQCGAEYRPGFERCSTCDVELVGEADQKPSRQLLTRPFLIALGVLVLAGAVVVFHAWPAPSEPRLSSAAAERACDAISAQHGGTTSSSSGESVANAAKLDQTFHMGATALLASVPKSKGVAICGVLASNLPVCDDGNSAVKLSMVLVTADGSRYVNWCPAAAP
jgi:hypothetical protein